MKFRSAALYLVLSVAGTLIADLVLPNAATFAQEPEPSPGPVPTPAPPVPPALSPAPRRSTTEISIGQAFLLDHRSIRERLQDDPNNPALLNELGNFLVQHGRLRQAIGQYEKALKIQPNLAIVWNNLGVAYTAGGRFADGERAYRRAIRLNPTYALAYYNLGANYDQRHVYDDALNYYQRAIELDPSLLDVRVNPQVASNRHLAAILVKSYLDKGGSVVLPVQSMYPSKPRKRSD